MSETATLLLMPVGDRPDAADFVAGDAFKTVEAALRAAHKGSGPTETLVPWIKYGGTIMAPDEIMATDTPPEPPTPADEPEAADRLDDDLDSTFPASDPPARTEP